MITGICSNCFAEVDADNMSHCPTCGFDLHQRWPFSAEETREFIVAGLHSQKVKEGKR